MKFLAIQQLKLKHIIAVRDEPIICIRKKYSTRQLVDSDDPTGNSLF